MATTKNITMKQFNGTDYDTLYPKTKVEQVEGAYTQQQILANATKALFGLGDTAVPDEVLARLGKYNQYWWKRRAVTSETIGDWEFVKSSERNAYPDSGIVDNYEYQYLGIPFENAVNAVKIETGSYMGTGTYGSRNPCSLTFDFSPILVYIVRKDISGNGYVDVMAKFYSICMDETYPGNSNNSNYYYQSVSANGGEAKLANNTLTWYASKAENQMNALDSSYEYRYVAIGL